MRRKRRKKNEYDDYFLYQQRDLALKTSSIIGQECGLEEYPDYLFEDDIFGDIICADCSTEMDEPVKTYEIKHTVAFHPINFMRLSICPRCKKVFRFAYSKTDGFNPVA